MSDIHRTTPLPPVSLWSACAQMMQIGIDQFTTMMALQAKRIARDRATAQHACDAWMYARSGNAAALIQELQSMMREYHAANVAMCEQALVSAATSQAANGALLRDVVLRAENAWLRAIPSQMAAQQTGTAPQAADWMTYLGSLMGIRPDGEAKPVSAQPGAASANA